MYLVHTVRNHLLFNIIEMSAHEDCLQLHTELVGEFATFGAKFYTYISNLVAFMFTIYKYVIHDYPMVLLSMSSTIRLSTSASDEVRVLFSLALKTMFFTAFTLVGEPTLPICAGSASMSAAPQVVNSRFLLAHTRFTLGATNQMPGLMDFQASSLSLHQDFGRFQLSASATANKYWMPMQSTLYTQYGFGGRSEEHTSELQ